jgi:AcrR family transcriptional regulator
MARGLSRAEIVAAALTLLDEAGLDGLNMRALADRLGVKAPAIYWHFAHKQALVDEMGTELWRQVVAAAPRTGSWQQRMVGFALELRRILLSHRDGAKLFSGTYLADVAVLEAQEEPLAALVASGVDLEVAVDISGVLYAYTVGAAIEEQAVRQTSLADDRYSLSQREQRLDPERFPLMTAAGRLAFPDPGARFERNVRRLVAGFEQWGSGPGGRPLA